MSNQKTTGTISLENITLPRGAGYVVKIKRNTQRPYCARRYVYTDSKGNAHSKDIGYYKTRSEAILALLEHIPLSASDLQRADITFAEVYDRWYAQAQSQLKPESLRVYRTSYKKCARLYNRIYASISAQDMQRVITSESSATSQRRIRDLFAKMDLMADSMDIIQKRRSDFLVVKKHYPIEQRVPLTEKEIEQLWAHSDDPDVQIALILIYTAFRSHEACLLLKENVNLKDMTIAGGEKTEAGTMRIVPVHPRIQPLIMSRLSGPAKYLLTAPRGGKMYMSRLEERFRHVTALYCDRPHIPHECRHTMQTRLDAAHADRICINKIMGHKPANVADRVYSHRTVEDLRAAILLLK